MPVVCLAGELDPALQQRLALLSADTPVDIIIDLQDRDGVPQLTAVQGVDRAGRLAAVIARAKARAATDAPELSQLLQRARGQRRRDLWLINSIAVQVPAAQVATIAAGNGVHRVRLDPPVTLIRSVEMQALSSAQAQAAIDGNAALINAHQLWDQGYTGDGIVVASLDSGVDGTHPDLAPRWRGGNNSWYDVFGDYATPTDGDGHGTLVMGVMVGGGTSGTTIGIAPDARWIAARIFDNTGNSSASAIHAALQWMLDPDGNPATDDAPDVINNSWGMSGTINQCNSEFQQDVDALKQAGIAVVFAGGNYGPDASTSLSPANGFGVLSVGAVDRGDIIADISSRGPSACDGGVYPLVTAPGVDITSTDLSLGGLNTFPYRTVTGTSIAAPFVSGTLALLRQVVPRASVGQLHQAVIDGARDVGDIGPDNAYGHGVIDANASAEALRGYPLVIPKKSKRGGLHPLTIFVLLTLLLRRGGRRHQWLPLAGLSVGVLLLVVDGLGPALADTAADRGAPVQKFEAPVFELDDKAVALGRRLYREGITVSGKAVEGIVAGDVRVTGHHLACVYCHKRSGFGAIEGDVVTPQITGDVLYTPKVSRAAEIYRLRSAESKTRPAYDDATLARAIGEGVNPTGRPLDTLMPRYVLGPEDRHNLISYLKSLNSAVSAGVTETEVTMAVVVSRDTDMAARRSLLQVLRRFLRDHNQDTRPHTARAQKSPWHKKWHYESHRVWDLRVWELDGPPQTWQRQLEVQYAQKPAFAVLGGVLGRGADALAVFCESKEMPCLFPMTDEPPVDRDYYYSLWFSRGLVLEAEALAAYLADHRPDSGELSLLQVTGKAGQAAAARLQNLLGGQPGIQLSSLSVDDKAVLSKAIGDARVVVYWLDNQELAKVNGLQPAPGAKVFLSASRTDVLDELDNIPLPAGNGIEIAMIYPYKLPKAMDTALRGTRQWLKLRKIAVQDLDVIANGLYTAQLVSRVMKHMGSNYSREYLLERLEHLDRDVAISPIYPRISLGPGQRFGSKGAYIVRVENDDKGSRRLMPDSDWIIPD